MGIISLILILVILVAAIEVYIRSQRRKSNKDYRRSPMGATYDFDSDLQFDDSDSSDSGGDD